MWSVDEGQQRTWKRQPQYTSLFKHMAKWEAAENVGYGATKELASMKALEVAKKAWHVYV